jgi:hypothetical protein
MHGHAQTRSQAMTLFLYLDSSVMLTGEIAYAAGDAVSIFKTSVILIRGLYEHVA